MKYQQTLFKILKDVVNPKILKKNNRFKKWEYGYNADYDFVVISKTGQIGEIIEIQNLRIALPAINKPFKRSEKKAEQYLEKQLYPKELNRIKSTFEWDKYPLEFKDYSIIFSVLSTGKSVSIIFMTTDRTNCVIA